MSNGRLHAIELERFKSYAERARLHLSPLLVLLGRNNSGKSSLIQPLLLLKQTLANPRSEIALDLAGQYVNARSLHDLTYGWPEHGTDVRGPWFALEWACRTDLRESKARWLSADAASVAKRAALPWLSNDQNEQELLVRMELEFVERDGQPTVQSLKFELLEPTRVFAAFAVEPDGRLSMTWNGNDAFPISNLVLDHFLPYVDVSRVQVGRNDHRRAFVNAWLSTFAPAIEDLRILLKDLQYLSSAREIPKDLNEPVASAPLEVGPAGGQASDMLKSRGHQLVHHLQQIMLHGDYVVVPEIVCELDLLGAVNDVLRDLRVRGRFSVQDAKLFGYRLLFGDAALPHVGRGLTYLLPVIEVGLLADPLRFEPHGTEMPLSKYVEKAGRVVPIALEEPESHIHPKVQSELAHWFVSLAMSNRQLLIETHSDHLVRRLRGLIARAPKGSSLEGTLLGLMRFYSVEKVPSGNGGHSKVLSLTPTPEGSLDAWPTDFMDEASDEDSAIYAAALQKREQDSYFSDLIHDDGEEPEVL